MFNLIKFELLKRKKILSIIGTFAILTQIFIITQHIKRDVDNSNALGSIVLFAFVSFIIFIFSSISTFSKDINSMDRSISFMVPKSGFQIIGSKFLAVLISGIILGLLESIWFFINAPFSTPGFNFKVILQSDSFTSTLQVALLSFATFASFLALVLLSIIITKTFLSRVKFKFIIIVVVMTLLSKVFNVLFWNNLDQIGSSNLIIDVLAISVFTGFMLWISGWLIDNKTDF